MQSKEARVDCLSACQPPPFLLHHRYGREGVDSLMLRQVRVELYDVRRTKFVEAHTTALACIALSLDGKLLATASERGTLVRVFSTADGSKVQVGSESSKR